jgi:WD40 repeat protein
MNTRRLGVVSIVLTLLFSTRASAQTPELNIQSGHPRGLWALSFDHDGRTLASGGREGLIKVWDVAARRELRVLPGHEGGVWAVAFSPGGEILASGGGDNLIRLWDTSTGREVGTLVGHAGLVSSVLFTDGGRTLVSGSEDKTIKFWDVAARREVRTLIGHTRPVTSISVSADGGRLASGSWESVIRLWDVSSGRQLSPLEGHGEAVPSVAFSPRGRLLASASSDGSVKLWDVDAGRAVRSIRDEFNIFTAVAFSADGSVLATGFSGMSRVLNGRSDTSGVTLKLWDVVTGRELHALRGSPFVKSIAFSGDGRVVACGGMFTHVDLWGVQAGENLGALSGVSNIFREFALSPDGRALAVVAGSTYSPPPLPADGEAVSRAVGEGTLKVWDLISGELRYTLGGLGGAVGEVIFSREGKYLAAAVGPELHVWEATTGLHVRTLRGDEYGLAPIAFAEGGKQLVTKTGDQFIRLWELDTGRELLRVKGNEEASSVIAVGGGGRRVAFMDDRKNIKVASVGAGRSVKTLKGHQEWVSSIAFAGAGDLLASASQDRTVRLWDAGRGVATLTLKGHTAGVNAVAFSRDGRTLASASANEIKLWDVAAGRELRTVGAGCAGGLLFGPEGRTLMCEGTRTEIKFLDATAGEELATVITVDGQDWVAVTPNGLFDGSHTAWRYLLWRFSQKLYDVAPVEAFFGEFYYPGLLGEVLSGKTPGAPSEIAKKDRRRPRLTLSTPGLTARERVTSRRVNVRVEVEEASADAEHGAGGGARDVRLFRNGSLVKVWRGDVLKGKGRATLETDVSITAGVNRLSAYAFNRDNVKSDDEALTLSGADGLRRDGVIYLLTVGVNQYSNPAFNLRLAVPDALLFGERVSRQQQRLGRFGRVEVVPLLDREATKSNILFALGRLAGGPPAPAGRRLPASLERLRPAEPEDAVFVYFAGHGIARGNRFLLVPHDLGYGGDRAEIAAGLRAILDHSIDDRELESAFEGIDAAQLLLVVDACNSGQALDSEERRRGPMNSKGLAQLAYEKGMYVLTAAQSYQQAVASNALGHGYLTYALAEEGLTAASADVAPKDGKIQLREWLNYASERVPQLRRTAAPETREIFQGPAARPSESDVQVPRVYYRREDDASDFIVGALNQVGLKELP